jgi:hypothetical protein
MFRFIGLCLGTLVRFLRARRSLLLENLALRQQLAVLKRRHPRLRLDLLDKQALLGRRPSILVRMATIPPCGHARNGGALAQGRIPFVLKADLQGQGAGRETPDVEGDSGIDLPDGR